MNVPGKDASEGGDVFCTWMKSVIDFWIQWADSVIPGKNSGSGETERIHAETEAPRLAGNGPQTLAACAAALGALSSAMGRPDSLMAALRSITAIPDIILKMSEPVYGHLVDMAGNMRGQMEKTVHYAAAPGMDHQAFRIWQEIYDSEFKKFINIPQLGLMRYHQEKLNCFFDRLAQLEATMAGFLQLVFQPLYDAQVTFQEQIARKIIQNGLPEDPKSYYTIWIRILEDHYMLLLRNPEYLKMMSEALNAAAAYAKSRRELVNDWLHYFSLPGVSDFEEMHKEMYLMKKTLKKLESTINPPFGGES